MDHLSTSVIIPTLNGSKYIEQALDSVLRQIDRQDQVIVVDNDSSDATPEILKRYQPRVTVLHQTRRGPSAARNAGLTAADRDFIAFLDHDDFWPEGRHAAFLHCIAESPGCNSVVGRLRILIEDGVDAGAYRSWDRQFDPKKLDTCLISRDLIQSVGYFDETLHHGEDNDYYLRLVEAGFRPKACDVDALWYRRHASNLTNEAPDKTRIMMDLVRRKMARRRVEPE